MLEQTAKLAAGPFFPCPRVERMRDVIQLDGQVGRKLLVAADHIEFRFPAIERTRCAYQPVSL